MVPGFIANVVTGVMVLVKIIIVKSVVVILHVTCEVRKYSLQEAINGKFRAGFVVEPCRQ